MTTVDEIMQLCRLCLVKDQVNVSIFDEETEMQKIFTKINTLLPVKVAKNDNLPKKICDDCSFKLDMLYIFRKKSAESEKQLNVWLASGSKDPKPEVLVKQETFESAESRTDDEHVGAAAYLMQQELEELDESALEEEPARKRIKRTPKSAAETDEDEFDDSMITKAEDDDSDDLDQGDYAEDPSLGTDDEQPGPSGVAKGTTETPSLTFTCTICSQEFPNKNDFLKHHNRQGALYNCCKCPTNFRNVTKLYSHLEAHKSANTQTVYVDEDGQVVEEVVLNYNETNPNELLYILDDDPVGEVVVQENADNPMQKKKPKRKDTVNLVQLEHGYVIPNAPGAIVTVTDKGVVQSTTPSRSRASQPKRRHVVPDFSSTNYLYISPNAEVDMPHYKCLRCEQLFISKFVFFRHIEKGKCYINNCDVCNATFEKNSDFYYHYAMQHTDRAICNFCFRTFMYEKNVKEHMLRHLDQFRHRCDECNKGFYTVREYRNHYKNRHMGIRYTCQTCGRSFADEYYFRRHLATHEQASAIIE